MSKRLLLGVISDISEAFRFLEGFSVDTEDCGFSIDTETVASL